MKNLLLFLSIFSIGLLASQEKGSGKYSIKNVEINTKNSDYGATFYGKDKLVFATPKKRYHYCK